MILLKNLFEKKEGTLTLEPGIPEVKRPLDETLMTLRPTKDLVASHVGNNPEIDMRSSEILCWFTHSPLISSEILERTVSWLPLYDVQKISLGRYLHSGRGSVAAEVAGVPGHVEDGDVDADARDVLREGAQE